MSQRALVKDHVRYLLFSEIYHRLTEPKNKRKAMGLLEVAIQCFDRKGFDGVTLKMIAREAGVTPPLVRHYFRDLDEIRELAIKYIGFISAKIVVDEMEGASRPDEMLKRYFRGHWVWARSYKRHLRIWLGFLLSASKRPTDRVMNTAAVLTGRERITTILADGKKAGVFPNMNPDLSESEVAAQIQALLLGWLVSLITENIGDPELYSRLVLAQCMALAGATEGIHPQSWA